VGEVLGSFPSEVGIFSSEMTERGSLSVDGSLKVEFLDDHTGSEVEVFGHNLL